jgi:hypothetical protein
LPRKKHDEKAYEIKDKRRVNPDGTLKQNAEPEPAPQEQPTEAPTEEPAAEPQAEQAAQAAGPQAEAPPPNVFEMLQFVTGLLAEQAWQFMGIHLPPGRKEPVKDLSQAKIAIDTVVFIADRIHPHLDDESRKAIRGIITDLQLNFVQRNR